MQSKTAKGNALSAVEADIKEEEARVEGIDAEVKRLTDATHKLRNR